MKSKIQEDGMSNGDSSQSRIEVYEDVGNIVRSGGYRMKFDVHREFACCANA